MSLIEDLRAVARKLLTDEDESRRVDVVIGYGKGTLQLRSTPIFVRDAAGAEDLIYDRTCGANLVRYLQKVTGRAAVVLKGCDSRALVESLKEKQIDKDRVVIIAVPCPGVIDVEAVTRALGGAEILDADVGDSQITVRTTEGERALPFEEFLVQRCRCCDARDVVVPEGLRVERVGGDAVAAAGAGGAVNEFEQKSPEERWVWFAEEVSRCILCYACRSACPMCYCKECFVESTQPPWLGREHNLSNQQVYHLVRALHLAGRCVGCGDCIRTCPMGVDVTLLGEKLRETVKELYGADPGADPEEAQAVTSYKTDDWQDFIL